MPDLDIGNLFSPYLRHDPVTDRATLHYRTRHNRLTSQRAEEFRACVGNLTRDRTHRGQGSAEDARETRAALANAAHLCAGKTQPLYSRTKSSEAICAEADRLARAWNAADAAYQDAIRSGRDAGQVRSAWTEQERAYRTWKNADFRCRDARMREFQGG